MTHFEYERRRTIAVSGGIKAQTVKGKSFGEKWWSKRWLEFIENSDIGERVNRGRSYARRGQVMDIEIGSGLVTAKVQGSDPRPYRVKIECETLSDDQWQKVARVFGKNTGALARLVAGSLPENTEALFKDAGVALFPDLRGDIQTECSCPDWSNPCKHTAAVYYLLAEEFDRDPLGLFVLRGKTRDEFLALVKRNQLVVTDDVVAEPVGVVEEIAAEELENLPVGVGEFWGRREFQSSALDDLTVPQTAAVLVKRLGNFPLWRGENGFIEEMAEIYGAASARTKELLLGRDF